jgi:hypothetical protein
MSSTSTSGLYCFSGRRDQDISLSSLEVKYAQILRARTPCQSVSFLNGANVTTNDLVVQNLTVTNSFMVPPSAGGTFASAGGAAASVPAGAWVLLSNSEFPLVANANNTGLSLSGNTITISDDGWYVLSLQGTFSNASAVDLGFAVNSLDPAFSLVTLPAGMGTVDSNTTILYLNAGDTVNLAANGSAMTTLTVNPAELGISHLGA